MRLILAPFWYAGNTILYNFQIVIDEIVAIGSFVYVILRMRRQRVDNFWRKLRLMVTFWRRD